MIYALISVVVTLLSDPGTDSLTFLVELDKLIYAEKCEPEI